MTDTVVKPCVPSLEIGTKVLGRYTVDAFLSRGGMGEVYRGRHELLEYPVALKVIREGATESLRKRFLREATLMARVRHPNVVAVLDFGILDSGWPCLAMEFVEGEELRHRLDRRGPLPWDEALDIFRGILAGLTRVHAAHVLHRDLKPSNIVLAAGPPEVVKLIDFGIALGTDGDDSTRYTESGMAVGTPEYMAPEQLLCEPVDARSDLYSATLVLYTMLSGASPFSGEGLSSAIKRFTEATPPPESPDHNADVPLVLQQLVLAMLSPMPDDRLQSAEQYLALVDAIRRDPLAADLGDLELSEPPPPGGGSNHDVSGDEPTAAIRSPGHRPGADRPSPGPPRSASSPIRVPPSEGTGDLESAPSMPVVEGARAILGARLPAARLKAKDERSWLASIVRGLGRAYSIGGQFWFVLLELPGDEERDRQVEHLTDSLRERYGDRTEVAWCPVDTSFQLTTASLSGAVPLPVELQSLIRELTSGV